MDLAVVDVTSFGPKSAQGLKLTIDREILAVRDRHLAQEGIRAGVT